MVSKVEFELMITDIYNSGNTFINFLQLLLCNYESIYSKDYPPNSKAEKSQAKHR